MNNNNNNNNTTTTNGVLCTFELGPPNGSDFTQTFELGSWDEQQQQQQKQ